MDLRLGYEWRMEQKSVRFPFAIRVEVALALFLFAATLSLFWSARGFGYIHLDDYAYVADNPMVAGGLRWEAVKQAFATVHEQWWLPLLWISYVADVDLFGPGPHGHHFVNVLLHAANAALLFWALFRMTGSRWRSAFVAALFAWHPTRVEAVAWIAARKDVLSGLFFMLALLAYVRHAQKPSALRMAPVFLLLLAGLASKAVLVAVPFVLLALDAWPLRRAKTVWGAGAWREWRPLLLEKIPLLLLAAVFVAINVHTHTSGMGGDKPVPPAIRLGLIAPNVFAYLAKLAAPVRLNVLYPECDGVSWPRSIAAALVLAGALALAFRWRARRPHLLAGGLWFLLLLAPWCAGCGWVWRSMRIAGPICPWSGWASRWLGKRPHGPERRPSGAVWFPRRGSRFWRRACGGLRRNWAGGGIRSSCFPAPLFWRRTIPSSTPTTAWICSPPAGRGRPRRNWSPPSAWSRGTPTTTRTGVWPCCNWGARRRRWPRRTRPSPWPPAPPAPGSTAASRWRNWAAATKPWPSSKKPCACGPAMRRRI